MLAGGCFWCMEAVFVGLNGIESVQSGYSGGTVADPSYEQVCTGATGHAEAVRLEFDPSVVSYADILRVFFTMHDPTTKDRQGNDIGTQYRSVVFYLDDQQRETAEAVMREIGESGIYGAPLVTELEPLKNFYPAEEYHDDYFARNPRQPYCAAVIAPKVAKFRKLYLDRLRPGYA
ncbi:MAG TPA: peptide-methionine (S)-S-oxide reductase MsrA [Trueperaceae bacterium]|nr:peptide-methionine (S)-S-oxide reductase MsrA [Trueperaceae bacterium]